MISFYVIPQVGHVDPMSPVVMSFTDFTSSPQKIGTCLSFSTLLQEKQLSSECSPRGPQSSVQFCSVAQSCLTLCNPMNCSMPGLPVHHQLPEFSQTHVHRVSDAIQPSHPLLSPSPPAPNPFQHQSFPMSQLFACGGQSTGASALASFLPKNTQG